MEDTHGQGRPEKQILEKPGNPEHIIKTIRAENNIRKTEVKPGPLKLFKA